MKTRPRLIVPEVVQTSAMDCGPASLKSLFEGFGIPVSYGRLREACQTDVDGTSIDTMEEVARQIGLDAEQIMIPADFVLMREAEALPAIVVIRQPNGGTHFIVVWRQQWNLVEIMDPAIGRRWVPREQFLSTLYIHSMAVGVSAWREWASSEKNLSPLRRYMADAGVSKIVACQMLNSAMADQDWRPLAAIEAATRTMHALIRSGGIARGLEAERVLQRLAMEASDDASDEAGNIPPEYWSVRPAPPSSEGEEMLLFRGAVLVRVRGLPASGSTKIAMEAVDESTPPLFSDLIAALHEKPSPPGRELLRLLREDGYLAPAAIGVALFLAATGVLFQAVLFRSLLDLPREFQLSGQRLGIMSALLVFMTALVLFELPIASGLLRIGRQLEARLRIAFLNKIPHLGDRYFHSRLISDMAERSHSVHRIRLLPDLGGQLTRSIFELVLTVAGIIWLDPRIFGIAVSAALFAVVLPIAVQPLLAERDLRLRSHTGALSRFYLDSLLGLIPLHTHGAQRPLRREHEGLLVEWARAGMGVQRLVVGVEAAQYLTGFGLAALLVLHHASRFAESGGVLLLVYWALNLPVLGQEIAQIAWQYPLHRNVTLRLLEPLGAPAEERAEVLSSPSPTAQTHLPGVAIVMQDVGVRVSGHTVLENINVAIEPSSHVSIVGQSGAGKSSLVGLLLGWHRPATGRVLLDGCPLETELLARLREETAWVDPSVQLWNRTLFDNLRYGADSAIPDADLFEQAGLRDLLQRLPDGLQTELGESGGLVSGGEGQRVRLGRAMLKPAVRLAILDEPFRGLDRQQRRELLANARKHWRDATLVCITHDVGDTLGFPRVLVVEAGHIVEDGPPLELAQQANSRYAALLESETAVREGLWCNRIWRRLRLDGGQLTEERIRVAA